MLKEVEATIEYEVNDAIDLSTDIPSTTMEMHGKEESNNDNKDMKLVVEPSKTLLFCKKMKKLLPHCLPLKERMKD